MGLWIFLLRGSVPESVLTDTMASDSRLLNFGIGGLSLILRLGSVANLSAAVLVSLATKLASIGVVPNEFIPAAGDWVLLGRRPTVA